MPCEARCLRAGENGLFSTGRSRLPLVSGLSSLGMEEMGVSFSL